MNNYHQPTVASPVHGDINQPIEALSSPQWHHQFHGFHSSRLSRLSWLSRLSQVFIAFIAFTAPRFRGWYLEPQDESTALLAKHSAFNSIVSNKVSVPPPLQEAWVFQKSREPENSLRTRTPNLIPEPESRYQTLWEPESRYQELWEPEFRFVCRKNLDPFCKDPKCCKHSGFKPLNKSLSFRYSVIYTATLFFPLSIALFVPQGFSHEKVFNEVCHCFCISYRPVCCVATSCIGITVEGVCQSTIVLVAHGERFGEIYQRTRTHCGIWGVEACICPTEACTSTSCMCCILCIYTRLYARWDRRE